jgi:hypothetical protein
MPGQGTKKKAVISLFYQKKQQYRLLSNGINGLKASDIITVPANR